MAESEDTAAIPVLEIGGTHVTAALADPYAGRVMSVHRRDLDSAGTAETIVDTLVDAAETLGTHPCWGIAVPGPFDYHLGIGRFAQVGKFDALADFDLSQALRSRLAGRPELIFLNDADAFGIGEVIGGAGQGHRRAVCLTLGTGVGSAFIADGVPVNDGPTVPPDGSVHLLSWHGADIEETVSRRGIRRRHAQLARTDLDVHEIAELARAGDRTAQQTFDETFRALGSCMAPWLARFEATALILGGSIAGYFDLLAGPLRRGILAVQPTLTINIQPAVHPETAALIGVAAHAIRARSTAQQNLLPGKELDFS